MIDRQQIAANRSPPTEPPAASLATSGPIHWASVAHATDELVTVLESEMEFEVEGQVHHPKPGEELLIPAGAIHPDWWAAACPASSHLFHRAVP